MRLILTIMVMFFIALLVAQPMTIPHTVYVGFTDSQGVILEEDEIYWEAWRMNYPQDVLNKINSRSSRYIKVEERSASLIQVQTADFEIPLEEGDIVQVIVLELVTGDMCHVSIPTELKNSHEMYPDIERLNSDEAPPASVLEVNCENLTVDVDAVISWDKSDRAEGYRIYLGVAENYLMQIVDVKKEILNYKPKLEPGKNYWLTIEPYNEHGSSIYNKAFQFKTKVD
ncbi:MAG: hypothetical protein P9L91_00705 [Candidatus Zophobacter franzmannii]|nr:hypothetical protein [Candidatus Zophobacter franzmannii]